MVNRTFAVDGDIVTVDADGSHHIPAGGGAYSITPVISQSFVYISGVLVIPDATIFTCHEAMNARVRNSFTNFVFMFPESDGMSSGQPILDGETLLTELDGTTNYHHGTTVPVAASSVFVFMDV